MREARAAARAGYRVDVICLVDSGQVRREVLDAINVHRIGITRHRGAGLFRVVREYVAFAVRASAVAIRLRIRDRAACEHIVQVHAPPDFLIVAGIVPKLLGSKLILDIHDLSRHLYLARFQDRRVAPFANRV
ncbi:MAG: hypothetical protein JO181_03770, partial [Solirubrobacterales bacterium]|nr:hypothetical protein [Solirubrobacterales bacterium]